jgi:hypothetical protein
MKNLRRVFFRILKILKISITHLLSEQIKSKFIWFQKELLFLKICKFEKSQTSAFDLPDRTRFQGQLAFQQSEIASESLFRLTLTGATQFKKTNYNNLLTVDQ